MDIVPMRKSVNLLTDFMNSRKTNKQILSIKQKHAAVFCKKDTVLMETGVISFTLHCKLPTINLVQMTSISLRLSFWRRNNQDFSNYSVIEELP